VVFAVDFRNDSEAILPDVATNEFPEALDVLFVLAFDTIPSGSPDQLHPTATFSNK
jgi:hypothetical protein